MEFGVSCETVQSALVVTVRGDIDMATAPLLWESINQHWVSEDSLVLDVSNVPFMDSTGLGVLIRAAERAKPHGVVVAVVGAVSRVRKVIEITGIDTFIFMGESVADGLRATEIT
ncbi:MAG: anti-sigma factor antagonist [Actinobacteria bacterium]|nr:anti-sigma factor antagonist [Actinomycetota bacterium]